MGTTEQRATLDREFVDDFARRYEEAWTSHDPARVADMCTEDVVWADPALAEPMRGRDGVRRFVAATLRMAPDFVAPATDRPFISPTEPRVLLPYRMSGTMTGPFEFMNLEPTGRSFEIDGVDSWQMRDGLIARYNTYYDSIEMAQQLGFLPAHGSGAESVMRRMQHVQARFQRRSAR